MTLRLQEFIHKMEVGSGIAVMRGLLGVLVLASVAVFYDLAAYRNLSSPEGMDLAQLARNLAQGRGYTTSCIRPLSLHLVFQQATNQIALAEARKDQDSKLIEHTWLARLQKAHPDLANPPLYPVLLAGFLKACPWGLEGDTAVWESGVQPVDLWVTVFNQLWLAVAVLLAFRLARRLFDGAVAWVSAVAFLGSEALWRISTTGESVTLQMALVLGLVSVLAALEAEAEVTPEPGPGRLLRLAIGAGFLAGLAGLTRYALIGLILPVVWRVASVPGRWRGLRVLACLLSFTLLLGPWVARNMMLSGAPFGTATYAVYQATPMFPGDLLERCIQPDFREFTTWEIRVKFLQGLGTLIQEEWTRLGGSWVAAFFLVGLLVPFRKLLLGRTRMVVVAILIGFTLVEAVCGGTVGDKSGEWRPNALLATMSPLVFIFGVALFFSVLDQLAARYQGIRIPAIAVFCLVACAPLILVFIRPGPSPLVYPPYYPPWIREKARTLSESEWVMSDVPWAVAWYGNRTAVWWTPYHKTPGEGWYQNDFYAIHNRFKGLSALYLSTQSTDKVKTRSLEPWISRSGESEEWEKYVWDWESFILLGIYLKGEVPGGFPLRSAPFGIFPELFLMDSERQEAKSIQSR